MSSAQQRHDSQQTEPPNNSMEQTFWATCETHPYCRNCEHSSIPHRSTSWCYMFRDGNHVDIQGSCGQFRLRSEPPNGELGHGSEPLQMVANDLHAKGLLAAGNHTILIDW